MEQLIGTIAAVCTTLSFLPQTVKTLKTRDTSGISLSMYVIFSIGIALWLTYGLMLGNAPLIYSNIVTLMLALTILYMKVTNKPKPSTAPDGN